MEEDQPLELEVFKRNPLAELVNLLHGILNVFTISMALFRNWWFSEELARVINELLRLEKHCVKYCKLDMEECLQFDRFIIHKGLMSILLIVSTLLLEYGMSPINKVQYYIGVLTITALQLSMMVMALQFYFAVLHIYRLVWVVNRQLLRLANHLADGSTTVDASKFPMMLQDYRLVLNLSHRIVSIYDYQVTLHLITFLTANMMGVFFFIVINISLQNSSDFIAFIIFPQAIAFNLWDFWLSIEICDLVEQSGRQTSAILKLFSDFNGLSVEFERTVQVFALFISHRKLQIRHCGLFYVNNALGFQMIVTSVLYLIFFVQFDFMNL
ncbi:gustatory receptor for bitter taste 22e-like [Scaptodrosophila lebanonensis]|uniref:Gustatory receptor n=1 Tax=Drosophila lebanonensis TaxID=7225 RepID=A0A6J2U9S0_DROLE|nr:gustatory receptor for bitter taste 22e-like [Scaptodrosophila lebanonensis]